MEIYISGNFLKTFNKQTMARKLLTLFFILAAGTFSYAQQGAGMQKIAPFQITLSTGKPFGASQLSPGAVVLIYFSPDCEHCQNFTKDLLKNFSVVGNKQVVMVTPQSMEMLKPFVANYNLTNYPNIKAGIEPSPYLVQKYNQIRHYPFVALYDKTGKFVKSFEGEKPHAEIFSAIKGL
jgi:cytochrome oxidase Cu insertion factor (SCO1/SenC/PrrC family)